MVKASSVKIPNNQYLIPNQFLMTNSKMTKKEYLDIRHFDLGIDYILGQLDIRNLQWDLLFGIYPRIGVATKSNKPINQ